MVVNLSELLQQERAILEDRRQQHLHERRARRDKLRTSRSSGRALLTATSLSDIEGVTDRPGFLREQLKLVNLTPLQRWHLQLKLLAVEETKTQRSVSIEDRNDVESAKQSLEKVFSRDQRCYDVVYREGARVTDARDSLLDDNASINVKEVLSFSTRHENFMCRVTCVHDGKRVLFNSTLYIEGLQTELERLLIEQSSIDAVITIIRNTQH
ncbi:hypothetical protein L914_20371 [Phytophthora nicotianae]|uniref:Uncharacterized protein n=1 Tax=Phytophthora nicotianae TaxID=4792 RepID=W2M782_PHYNI|nr:hypothetical protein L914_20371 [Phytophthora nicotianae]